jgi:hypothetical protein
MSPLKIDILITKMRCKLNLLLEINNLDLQNEEVLRYSRLLDRVIYKYYKESVKSENVYVNTLKNRD